MFQFLLGKFSDIATNDLTNQKEGDSLKRVKRAETTGDSGGTGKSTVSDSVDPFSNPYLCLTLQAFI